MLEKYEQYKINNEGRWYSYEELSNKYSNDILCGFEKLVETPRKYLIQPIYLTTKLTAEDSREIINELDKQAKEITKEYNYKYFKPYVFRGGDWIETHQITVKSFNNNY